MGSQLTVTLARQGHTVSVIDKNARAFERLPPGFEGQTLVGMVFDRETMEEAGIQGAGAFIAVTNGDNSNIVSARIAREHYGIERVVARIYDPRRAEIYQRLGIKTVATVRWAAAEIHDILFHGVEHAELALGNGDVVMLRIEIGANLAGQRVSSVEEPEKALVAAVDRMGTPVIPTPKSTFQKDDIAHIVVARDAIGWLRERLQEEGH